VVIANEKYFYKRKSLVQYAILVNIVDKIHIKCEISFSGKLFASISTRLQNLIYERGANNEDIVQNQRMIRFVISIKVLLHLW